VKHGPKTGAYPDCEMSLDIAFKNFKLNLNYVSEGHKSSSTFVVTLWRRKGRTSTRE